ncbi:TPA: hypothetical protein DIC20_00870 [Candidatus Dependentiae bacterium]|nr:MAG: hypothetical protein US03_C0015G0017 [candidate division TM6 bacterium GW2011_GWF2_36_131]KKQ02820.1 MAG: hypothetical protein US13_C0009G0012 [candidate division TM6 bacterium GW2011_GWE2_36_25]KKQ18971.1 MAG: hypothetical protein US32_C0019G0014 [candidate division TM6 bacterium GW2011_GWA2_36_9]HBR70998.1 hypothetical protein [Candidatus Dependentiae bacterium]HCU00239.1 hypothetical protein [Candidatus Dependentiae bacterium]
MKKLFLSILLLIPLQQYGCCGGDGWGWGPAVFGTTMAAGLTAAAVSSSNRPQTVVIEEQPKRSAKKEIMYLRKQMKKLMADNQKMNEMMHGLQKENTSLKKALNLSQATGA